MFRNRITRIGLASAALLMPRGGVCQLDLPNDSWAYGYSQTLRIADNQMRLYASTWVEGGFYQDWTAIVDDSRAWLDTSDPKGATSTPHWYLAAGSTYGALSCADCPTPTYTVTERSPSCWTYGGLESETFWIFNDSPYDLHRLWTTPINRSDGWETQAKLKVRDMCGGGMNWVVVRETFENAEFKFPDPTSGWELFTWPWAEWTGSEFDGTGAFDDKMYQLRQPGKSPQPMNTGANGNSEAPAATVMQADQKFFAGSETPPTIVVGQNKQVHYLDHGAHK